MNSKSRCSTTTTGPRDSSRANMLPSPYNPTRRRQRDHRRSPAHCPKFLRPGPRGNPTDLRDVAANPRASGRESSGDLHVCSRDYPNARPDFSENRRDAPGVGRLAGSKHRSCCKLARAICNRDLASARSNLDVAEEEEAVDRRQDDLREADWADSRLPRRAQSRPRPHWQCRENCRHRFYLGAGMDPYRDGFLWRLHYEREVARADFQCHESVDCWMATALRFLPLMDDRQLIDLGLDLMALDRHSAAFRQDRRTTENFSEHCKGQKNCRRFHGKKYCCRPKRCHHCQEKNCCQHQTDHRRRRQKNRRYRERNSRHRQRNCHLLAKHSLHREKSFRRRAKTRRLRVPRRLHVHHRGQATARDRELTPR